MRSFPLPFLFLFISFATPAKKAAAPWKPIEIGDYILDFPPDFILSPMRGIDSHVGKIDGDSIHFKFDFGYYSPSFGKTPQEYLKQGFWKREAGYQFMRRWRKYNDSNWPQVEILSVRPAVQEDSTLGSGCDYVARCKHKNKQFDYAIFLPEETKGYDFEIDSASSVYRKIVLAKNSQEGATGLYIREMKQSTKSMNSCLALSVFTTKLTKAQQALVVKIYKTARLNRKK